MSGIMTPDDVIPTYERVGQLWAKTRSRSLMEKAWLDRFLATAPRSTGKPRILDVGCGSGQPIGSYLMERGVTLTGVDATARMTGIYAKALPKAKVIKTDMRSMTLGEPFDGILAWNSFFHLSAEDQRMMFAVFAAHAAPRAALMFTSGHIAGEAIGSVADAPIYHASLAQEEYRALLKEQGFTVLHHIAEDPDCGQHTVWLAQFQR